MTNNCKHDKETLSWQEAAWFRLSESVSLWRGDLWRDWMKLDVYCVTLSSPGRGTTMSKAHRHVNQNMSSILLEASEWWKGERRGLSQACRIAVALKICWLPSWVMDLWLMHDIVTSCIGHLKNTSSWSLKHVFWKLHFIAQHQKKTTKNTDINITIALIRKDWKYCKVLGSWWQIGVFQNSNSYLKAPILSLATNAVSYFPWRNSLIVCYQESICQKCKSE